MKAKEVIALLLPIPESQFIVDSFSNQINCCCVVGHIARLTSANTLDYGNGNTSPVISKEVEGRIRPFLDDCEKFLESIGSIRRSITHVNDGEVPKYQHPSIKERSLMLLRDMDVAGY